MTREDGERLGALTLDALGVAEERFVGTSLLAASLVVVLADDEDPDAVHVVTATYPE